MNTIYKEFECGQKTILVWGVWFVRDPEEVSVNTTTTTNPDILNPTVIRRIALILAGLPVGEAVSLQGVAEGISLWSPTMFAVLSGAVMVMAVVGMMMSGAPSVASERSVERRQTEVCEFSNGRSFRARSMDGYPLS